VELRGRGDVQLSASSWADMTTSPSRRASPRTPAFGEMPRSFFNVMAKEAHIADWREAFTYGAGEGDRDRRDPQADRHEGLQDQNLREVGYRGEAKRGPLKAPA